MPSLRHAMRAASTPIARSLPYPSLRSLQALREGSALQALDTDGSGKIEFDEWLVLLALLSIPADDITGAFCWGCVRGGPGGAAPPPPGMKPAVPRFRQSHSHSRCPLPAHTPGPFSHLVTAFPRTPASSSVAFHLLDTDSSGTIEVGELETLLHNVVSRFRKALPETGTFDRSSATSTRWESAALGEEGGEQEGKGCVGKLC